MHRHDFSRSALGTCSVVALAFATACASPMAHDPIAGPDAMANGTRAYREGRNSDAELIWRETLAESETYGDDDPRLAQSLFVLSNLAIHEQRFDEARSMLERWLRIQERGPG